MKSTLFGIIILCVATLSCKHPIPVPQVLCEDIFSPIHRDSCTHTPPSNNDPGGYYNLIADTFPAYPLLNPGNEDELIFALFEPDSNIFNNRYALWKINMCSDSKKKLVDGIFEPFDINSNGWILFGKEDRHIWAIKTNGDSLRQLTFNGVNYDAQWFPKKSVFSFLHDDGNGTKLLQMDFKSGETDTVTAFINKTDIFTFSKTQDSAITLLYKDDRIGLNLFDMNTKEEELLYEEEMDWSASPANWIYRIVWPKNSTKIYWTQAANLYELDLITRQKRTLFSGCIGDRFLNITKSSTESYLIAGWEKETVIVPDDTLKIDYSLLRMDVTNPALLERLTLKW